MANGDDIYPNLEFCSIIPALSSGTSHAPPSVAISSECLEAMSKPIPPVYDYEVGKNEPFYRCVKFCLII